ARSGSTAPVARPASPGRSCATPPATDDTPPGFRTTATRRRPMTDTLSAREAAVAAAIDPARLAGEVAALCAIPSVTGSEAGAQRLAARWMREANLAVDEIAVDPSAIAADPDFPGSEVERTELPVVIGRAG